MNAVQVTFSLVLAAIVTSTSLAGPVRAEELGKLFGDGQDGQGVGTSVLAGQRGGTSQEINAVTVATVAGNTVGDNSITGNVSFGSFGSAQGMFNVLQNTGNNVAMQSQLVINVNLQ